MAASKHRETERQGHKVQATSQRGNYARMHGIKAANRVKEARISKGKESQ
jgi:hypothetical protein